MVLKWICFTLICGDVVGYIISSFEDIKDCVELSSKICRFIGIVLGIAARIFVLCGTATGWLLI